MVQSNNPFSLAGKTILVTGASSGIGRSTAIEGSKMGARIILSAIPRESDMLQSVRNELEKGEHVIIPVDLRNESESRNLATDVPPLDGVVFAAGTLLPRPLAYYSMKNIQDAFSVNTFANMSLTKELVRAKKLNVGCSLVFISSIASHWVTAPTLDLYSASKAALDSFSKQCAVELADRRIRANTINPGIIQTGMVDSFASMMMNNPEEMIGSFERMCLLQRLGNPEEVAWMAVYLLSDASSFVTGSSFVIDGGLSIAK